MDIASIFASLKATLNLSSKYLFAVAIATSVMLFAPASFLDAIGIKTIVVSYRTWIGLGFLFASVLLFINFSTWISNLVSTSRSKRKRSASLRNKLNDLTEEEKQILRYYVAVGSKSNKLRTDDGVANGLVAAGAIFPASRVGNLVEGFAHNITEEAWQLLHEHPELLDGETNEYRTDARERW